MGLGEKISSSFITCFMQEIIATKRRAKYTPGVAYLIAEKIDENRLSDAFPKRT